MKRLFVLILLSAGSTLFATGWVNWYDFGGEDAGNHIECTFDGGYIITGYTYSDDGRGLLLLKLNQEGDTLWTRIYGRENRSEGHWVEQTTDGGFIVTGYIGSDVWLLKTDENGDTTWTNTYRYSEEYDSEGYVVQQTESGGYVIFASEHDKYRPPWVIWTDAEGNELRSFVCEQIDRYADGRLTSDGGCIITGRNSSTYETFLLKTDWQGNQEWMHNLGSVYYYNGRAVEQTTDGGYVLLSRNSSIYRPWLIVDRLDSVGNMIWETEIEQEGSLAGKYIVREKSDGSFVLTGNNAWLGKVDADGDVLWIENYIGSSSGVALATDGGYTLVGSIDSYWLENRNLLVIHTDGEGRIEREVSPTRILAPVEDTMTGWTFIEARAEYTNLSTEDVGDFYCKCDIVDTMTNRTVYTRRLRITDTLYAWETREIEIDKWIVITEPSTYRVEFSAYGFGGNSLKCRPAVTYFTIPEPEGVEESPASSTIVSITPIGSEIEISYSGCPEGFAARVFDASGRKIEEVTSTATQGRLSWGSDHAQGVYFIDVITQFGHRVSKVVLIK